MAHRGTPGRELTPAQRRAISALLSERDNRSAAAKARIGERTLYKWLHDDTFQRELQQAQTALDGETSRRLTASTLAAVDVLVDALKDAKVITKIRAADLLLTHRRQVRELDEIEQRISALENRK
jgi:hypothetical protein